MKSQRRRDLLRVLREGHARSQQEIVEALRDVGHDVTQATVSRDLHEVGATKLRVDDGFVYRLSDDVARSSTADLLARSLERTFAEFTLDVRPAHALVVLTTAPGHAGAVARALDHSEHLDQIVGTIAGDDTIFVATPSPEIAEELVHRWSIAAGIKTEVPL